MRLSFNKSVASTTAVGTPPYPTETGVQSLDYHDWNPANDTYAPPNAGAEAYAPPREAVPPQLPSPLQRTEPLEFEPHGFQPVVSDSSQNIQSFSLGFNAHTVVIDNYSNQWLYIVDARRYCPPYMINWTINIISGTPVANVLVQAPPGWTQAGVTSPAQGIVTHWIEDTLDVTPGTMLAQMTVV